ncbi:hypothetical protein AAFF_G00165060 [Aldrovandia affinis]|uniref:Uncharacterized protein n=1 Tax=Aldrovandia affinis TaxID=143900 RepID=A0AAD7W8L1_9TELE|nr:hypothetical protein AAFF_G00165060 [Aldrovandia affinis]
MPCPMALRQAEPATAETGVAASVPRFLCRGTSCRSHAAVPRPLRESTVLCQTRNPATHPPSITPRHSFTNSPILIHQPIGRCSWEDEAVEWMRSPRRPSPIRLCHLNPTLTPRG